MNCIRINLTIFKYDIKPKNNTFKPKCHCAMSNVGNQFREQNQLNNLMNIYIYILQLIYNIS